MPKLLKNWYDEKLIRAFTNELVKVYPSLNVKKFSQRVFNGTWNDKELKQRIRHILQTPHEFLPNYFSKENRALQFGL